MAITGWVASTDGDSRIQASTVWELKVLRISANTLNTNDPQGSTEAWGVFAIYTDGHTVQIGTTSSTKSAAITQLNGFTV